MMLILVILWPGATALAQRTTGEIIGKVTDESGAVLPGVTVTLRGAGVAGAPTAVTSETGTYRFPLLPPGTYDLEYVIQGFATLRREAIPVSVGGTVELDVTLGVSTIQETVTVTGESPVHRIYDSQPGVDPRSPSKSDARRVFWKFNYNMNPNHRLMHGYHDDYYWIPGITSQFTAPSTINEALPALRLASSRERSGLTSA